MVIGVNRYQILCSTLRRFIGLIQPTVFCDNSRFPVGAEIEILQSLHQAESGNLMHHCSGQTFLNDRRMTVLLLRSHGPAKQTTLHARTSLEIV